MDKLAKKWFVSLALLLVGNLCTVSAQQDSDPDFARSRQFYGYFTSGQGDSLHVMMNEQMKSAIPVSALNLMFSQLEQQFGKLQSQGAWQKQTAGGTTVYFTDLAFQRYTLRFQLAFDAQALVSGFFVKPAPTSSTPAAQATPPDNRAADERPVTVSTGSYQLPGTLALPRLASGAKRKVPCVILLHGSGPNDRDETIGPNKPFRDLAWGLAQRGIATLRYDKRTLVYGQAYAPDSLQGNYDTEAVDDALSAIALARNLPEVAADSIYVLGHSLGGMLAPRVAQRSGQLAGLILLAAAARPLEELLVEQCTYLASLQGNPGEAQKLLEQLKSQVPAAYWQFADAYKPTEAAASLSLPMLVLQGERDYQVTMEDFGLWRVALLRHKNATCKSYPALNHLFQEGKGKSTPDEYLHPSSLPAYLLDDVASFVHQLPVAP